MSDGSKSGARRAGQAVEAALRALREMPRSGSVTLALDGADAAVAALPPGLLQEVLQRQLGEMRQCHLHGLPSSPRLEAWTVTSDVALLISYHPAAEAVIEARTSSVEIA